MKTFLFFILPLLIGSLLRAAPSNDAFSAPTPLTGLPVSTATSNVSATLEAGEPVASSSATGSVWFSWTAPATGQVQVNTNGSNFDTMLAIWTGNALATLTLIGDDDDSGAGRQSLLAFQATAGATYRIAVYGYGSDSGSITLNLLPISTINGTITGPDGSLPLQNILVSAHQWDSGGYWSTIASTYTSSTGTYSLSGLAQGNYRLGFYDPQGNHVAEYYNNASALASANEIAVAASGTVSGINASLAAAGRITGTVTGPDGSSPLEDIYVTVYRWYDDGDGSGYWASLVTAHTNSNGIYSLGGLATGNYRVRFYDYDDNYVTEYYSNASTLEAATEVAVVSLETTSGINASLATPSRITGTITGPDGISPLNGIQVYLYQWYDGGGSGFWGSGASISTSPTGAYSIDGLAAGNYRLLFSDQAGNYLSEYYNNASTVNSATDIVVGESAIISGINASLSMPTRITGIVTGPDGITPLEDIQVRAYRRYDYGDGSGYWDYLITDYTNADGSYSLTGLNSGNYRLRFYDGNGNYVTEYFNNASTLESANDIAVAESATVSGINASLAITGGISGTVTGPDGISPLAGIQVRAYQFEDDGDGGGYWDYLRTAYTNASGSYLLGGLDAGNYRLRFYDAEGNYLAEYYNDASSVESATEVTVADTGTVSSINASLTSASHITGTVTGPDGVSPLEDIQVIAYRWYNDGDGGGYWSSFASTSTSSMGHYSLDGLVAENYRVRFYDYDGNYATEYFDNASTVESATGIVVGTSQTVSGIHASLGTTGSISGIVTGPDGSTPLQDIQVRAYQWYDDGDGSGYWDNDRFTYTNVDGSYSLNRLDVGNYRVRFYDPNGNYVTEFHHNSSTVEAASDIPLAASELLSGINASLAMRGGIAGTVTGPDGSLPLEGIEVQAYQWYDEGDGSGYWDYERSTYTNATGSYSFGGLTAGNYRVQFHDGAGTYVAEYYNNVSTLDSASDITVIDSVIASGINASLASAGRITGTVTGPDGSAQQYISIRAYQWRVDGGGSGYWSSVESTSTNSSGAYSLGGLAAGTYRLGFFDYDGIYATEYYNNASTVESASDVVVAASETISGINVALGIRGSISGIVTGPDGGSPLQYIQVRAYQWYDEGDGSGYWETSRTTYTNADGSYSLTRLDPGSYRLRFYDDYDDNYLTEYYNNAATVESASDITLAISETITGINASLQAFGTLDTPPGTTDLSLTPATATSNAKFSATVTGTPGASVVVEASPDMGTSSPWVVVHRFNLDSSGESALFNVEVPDSQGAGRWFFRLGYE